MMADIFNLWDNIARLRRERKITQEELADFLGVTKAAVSQVGEPSNYAGYSAAAPTGQLF